MPDKPKVVSLQPPNEALVELLEDFVKEAKCGNIIAIAGVAGGLNGTTWGFHTSNTEEDIYRWIGRIRALQLRYEDLVER